MHEVEMECFHCIVNHLVLVRIVFVVEGQAPGCFVLFSLNPNGSVELNTNRQVPFEVFTVKLEPHRIVFFKIVCRSIGIEQRLDIIENEEQIVLPRCHQLKLCQILIFCLHIDFLAFPW